ncbi:hypothetical protein [Gottfriedia acidiceleris]|uniref:hypothetical protein n=1 Tax=Gottfriedia acidiceleris TaxID=371036 RepID=UPI001F3B6D30|nr:hypothetical protein [Gottfriedia acidiceleris]
MCDKFNKIINWVEEIKVRNQSSGSALIIMKDNKIILEDYNSFHSNAVIQLQYSKHLGSIMPQLVKVISSQ